MSETKKMKKPVNRSRDLRRMLQPLERKMGYKTEFKQAFGPRGDQVILPAYRVMRDQLCLRADDDKKKIPVDDRTRNLVNRAAETIAGIAATEALTQYFRDFVGEYLPLMSNWNRQLGKSKSVDTLTKATQRIVGDMMTMKDMVNVTRRANTRLNELLRYEPPAFSLSRHYLLSLQSDIQKKEAREKMEQCSSAK